jgi:hypothetical protein
MDLAEFSASGSWNIVDSLFSLQFLRCVLSYRIWDKMDGQGILEIKRIRNDVLRARHGGSHLSFYLLGRWRL